MKINQLDLFGKSKQVLKITDFSKKERVARVLHLGAGLQSSTIAEMVTEGDLPRLDMAIFCDTGDEPKWVYDEVEHLTPRLKAISIPLVVLKKSEGGIVKDTQEGHGRFASMPFYTKDPASGRVGRLKRQCTSEYKIQVAEKYIRQWLVKRGFGKVTETKRGPRLNIAKTVYIESWFGISYDEIADRLKDRSTGWSKDIYPLIDKRFTKKSCVEWLIAKRLPIPGKSACLVCAFHDDEYWHNLSINHPAYFEHACSFDDWIRSDESRKWYNLGLKADVYLHRSCIPLREVDFIKQPPVEPLFCGAHCMT